MSGTDFYYETQVRLAEELAAIVPIAAACGRSSATPAPRRSRRAQAARYATERQNIIAFLGAFHGRTHGIAVADASKAIQRRGFGR
jgi:4-aminobutyrate aminotransferase